MTFLLTLKVQYAGLLWYLLVEMIFIFHNRYAIHELRELHAICMFISETQLWYVSCDFTVHLFCFRFSFSLHATINKNLMTKLLYAETQCGAERQYLVFES